MYQFNLRSLFANKVKVKVKFFLYKSKVKVVPVLLIKHHAMKAYWGNGSIAPRILDLGSRWEVSGQFHLPVALPPGEESMVSIG
jgi:hypothetical protein